MAEDKKVTESRPVEPVRVAMVGTGDGSRLTSGTVAQTEGAHAPNLVVTVVTPIVALAIRFISVFLPVFGAIWTGSAMTGIVTASDYLHLMYKCALLALIGCTGTFIKDLVTIFGRLEQKFPLLTGKV